MTDERKDITEAEKKPKAPKWYTRDSMFRAAIDLDEIEEGARATLRSARGREAKRIGPLAPKEGEMFSWECRAAIFAAHLDTLEGCGDLMDEKPPEKRSSVKAWSDWLDGVDENLTARLFDAMLLFRMDVFTDEKDSGETGNASTPPSED